MQVVFSLCIVRYGRYCGASGYFFRTECVAFGGLSVSKIVIDPVRCPLIFAKFSLKEYMRDREGNWIDEIPDGNDHSIDAIRYAMTDDVLRG